MSGFGLTYRRAEPTDIESIRVMNPRYTSKFQQALDRPDTIVYVADDHKFNAGGCSYTVTEDA